MDDSCERCKEFIPALLRKINNLEDRLMLYEANEYLGTKADLRKGYGCNCQHNWEFKNLKTIVICIVVSVVVFLVARQW